MSAIKHIHTQSYLVMVLCGTIAVNQLRKLMKKALFNVTPTPLTYVSLFSGAGIGCHGLTTAGFSCVATVELLSRRLDIQKINNKCQYTTGYICGDMGLEKTRNQIFDEVDKWKVHHANNIDVVIATPPCQGMSVCNHKKNNEQQRNSLVVSALETVKQIAPKIFIIENTALFLKTVCTLPDGAKMLIGDAIGHFLKDQYHIFPRKINLKNYGCPSSRTRTLVIGTSKKCRFSPITISPDWVPEKTLHEVIGDLPPLLKMGEISPHDVLHSFKPYSEHMRTWIADLSEGQSAFEQKFASKRPHRIVCGKRQENKNLNGDKYRKQRWDAPPPCIHTRNDILSSQNTVHPSDDRVFSIREIMRMMSIASDFKWHSVSTDKISTWSELKKQKFLKSHEMNIRQCIGESAPPNVIYQIAHKVALCLRDNAESRRQSENQKLSQVHFVRKQIKTKDSLVESLLTQIEKANISREKHAAYYTAPLPAFKLLEMLPNLRASKKIKILEPAAGIGRLLHFLPNLMADFEQVDIDAMDIDDAMLDIARVITGKMDTPPHIKINYQSGDFLTHRFVKKYDLIVSNPPFGRMDATKAAIYKKHLPNTGSPDVFSFFLTKSLDLAKHVVIISPKSILGTPGFKTLRNEINAKHAIRKICDFGETAFDGVKIETIVMHIETNCRQKPQDIVHVESVPMNFCVQQHAEYIFDAKFPYWVIYRNTEFDHTMRKMKMGVFRAFRDRQISKCHMRNSGNALVIKSRNIDSVQAKFTGHESYICDPDKFTAHRFMNRQDVLLVPNLTYNPRACRMPKNCIPDGSVAVLYPRNGAGKISDTSVRFFASDEFRRFYRTARNHGTRGLNIDANSVFFFGVKK